MKENSDHPPVWRSLREFDNDPGFAAQLEGEFPRGADTYEDSGLTKRDFLKLMGASMALAGAGLSGCRRPASSLVPFSKGVEWSVPGKFLYYATAMPTRTGAIPLVATTSDGRPTKLEGNPLHPCSNGGTDCFVQASVLDLYDPHRSKTITDNGRPADSATFDTFLDQLRKDANPGLAFLVEKTCSPTRDRLRAELAAKYPGLLWCEYEPLGDAEATAAREAAFGAGLRLRPDFEKADVLLALDSDFLNPAQSLDSSGFFKRRSPDAKPMNRLYVAENHFSLTGGMADHRLRCKVSDMAALVRGLAEFIAGKTGKSALSALAAAFPKSVHAADEAWISECATDLLHATGRSLVLTGPQTPAPVQVLVNAINDTLGNLGSTVQGMHDPSPAAGSISDLAKAITGGAVKTLFIFGGNPVYNAPADLNFGALLSKVPDVVRVGLFEDETSKASRWHVPAAHYLESWGDARTSDGTYTSIQPMILPLWGGRSEPDILGKLLGLQKTDGPDMVRATFEKLAPASDNKDHAWPAFLRNGFLPGSQFHAAGLKFSPESAARVAAKYSDPPEGLELVFLQSSSVDDGRHANNSWLQETPDFVTKLTWDNAALVSPATAKKLGLSTDGSQSAELIEISDGSKTITAAALVAPGHADDSISIALGYGRKDVSALMTGVGFDAYPLRRAACPRFTAGISVRRTGRTYELALTQEHHSMEGRDLVRAGTLDVYRQNPAFATETGGQIPGGPPLYESPPLTAKEQWGMTIDLNTCTGCNACAVACQAENNVPVVGKMQIRKSRDMAWIRLDRYFAGDPESPEMLPQAIMCQHCEQAPCETVCPVSATVHSEDGLNLMTYNRCIGTRYCANNCPWKVRRFNFFDYNERPLDELYWGPLANKGMAESLKMVKNPNVTVRMRGVMEKCTFCIQRIEEAKIARLVKSGPSPASQSPIAPFQSACQQACPAGAISFGNIADPASAVSRLRKSPRGYTMFDFLRTLPRVTYLARIKNPNPHMPA